MPSVAARGDCARRHAYVVSGADHHRPCHDAEQRNRRADRTGRDAEQRGGDDHHHVKRAAHRREQVAERLE